LIVFFLFHFFLLKNYRLLYGPYFQGVAKLAFFY
jgi:hypothetical protein